MHSREVRDRAMVAIRRGDSDATIARELGISKNTIRTWRYRPGVRYLPAALACDTCGSVRHDFTTLHSDSYAYLLGMYLGDGWLSEHRRGVFRLRIACDAKYPGIIRECGQAIRKVMPENAVGTRTYHHGTCVEMYCYSRAWRCLFPQHGPGRKHHRTIHLEQWQQTIVDAEPRRFLRGLIHSDGTRGINNRGRNGDWFGIRYGFSNRSADILRIFCETCDRLGIRWTQPNQYTISIAHAEDCAKLDRWIGRKS